MNYLAHAYLSFNIPEIVVGNMISDFVKGKKKFSYSEGIQKGILLHRSIDEFTDQHPVTRKAKIMFKQAYGLYSGAFMDVVYDHFLANDKNEFASPADLATFSRKTYATLSVFISVLPEPFKRILPHMQLYDWLYNYRSKEGIEQSFGGLVRRAKYLDESTSANKILQENYSTLQSSYSEFFPELKIYTVHQLASMTAA